jgi:tetratricopeptide (TPR) repeat protein
VDEFFEAALKYMGGGGIDPSKLQSANVRAQVLGAMLGAGRYIFVLDGLEVMQHEEGDKYGLLKSNDLRDFVQFFAGPDHESLCLITSRAPALDLMDYTTYAHRDVMRLSIEDGRALLTRLGVKGNDAELDRVVADWDGHALTLGLIGSHVAEKHDGDVAYASELDPPTVDESRYDGVRRVLRRYDEHLSEAERSFMKLFSAFRLPVKESAFEKIFRTATDKADLNAPIAALDDEAFEAMVGRLVGYRILRYDENACHYTAHPLIHSHYQSQLERCGQIQREAAHGRIKDYYLELAGDDIPQFPTLDDLAPLIEAVHHACKAGVYDEAEHIRWGRIDQGNRLVSSAVLGAYETRLALFLGFFPDGDTEQDPQVSDPHAKGFILNAVGFSLMNLGRMAEAVPFYESGNATALDMGDWKNVGRGYQNLAELHINLGALTSASDAAREALTLAKRAEDKSEERNSLAYQAWIAHLSGDSKTAGAVFKQAKSFERQIDPEIRFLYSRRGIHHADYLRRTGDADYARRVTEANMEICKLIPWPHRVSQCHRVLGDLDADAGHHDSARKHYDEALRIARSITKRAVLVEALLARGRWYARNMKESAAAFSDLNEALDYAVDGEYRIYEADIRIALSWAYLADGNQSAVRAEADRALNMSEDMGYHWGKVDAKEVLAELD